ncbi:hypothetical protein, partial [Streptomyces mirabilis]|uniref:hypothetical protein n=1 Tax=Streptomyces mirabilis TaxID=68239 RepID=UPI00368D3E73
ALADHASAEHHSIRPVNMSQRRISWPSHDESSTTCPDRARANVGQRMRPGSEVNVVTRAERMPCRITPPRCRVDCPMLNYWMLLMQC